MLTIIPGSDAVIAFEIDGRVDKADVERVIAVVDAKLADRPGALSILVIVREIGMFTPAAIARDVQYSLSRFADLSRFRRVAVVTDKGWVRSVVGLQDLAMPMVDIKAFAMADEDIARLWVKNGNPAATF
ncbi:STAS/SEC14 domain-containing protein [Aurantimonas sp. A2-1-M11]|uniref:STAS/SEC14 domain-containing protein n=1 Tax=Aurantimonas sp. A2-1-M11 TaxID=3113712 RepID=UPI002F9398A2